MKINRPYLSRVKFTILSLLLGVVSVAHVAVADEEALFQLDEKKYAIQDLPLSVQQSLYQAELKYYEERVNLINEALLELELDKRAQESGKSKDEVAQELFKVAEPGEEAIKKFYEENKARINQPLDAIKQQIAVYLQQEEQGKKQQEVLESIKENSIFNLAFNKPVAPITEIATTGYPEKGAENARAVLVEFADYQCPHCKRAGDSLKKVLEVFKEDLKIIYMDFPVNRSGISRKVAEGAACAGKQDKFWEYHDMAFDNQRDLKADSSSEFAEKLGLDMDAFKECLASDFPAEHVKKAEAEGNRLGVNATPTLFLNGRRLHIHNLEKDLPMEIKKVLEQAS